MPPQSVSTPQHIHPPLKFCARIIAKGTRKEHNSGGRKHAGGRQKAKLDTGQVREDMCQAAGGERGRYHYHLEREPSGPARERSETTAHRPPQIAWPAGHTLTSEGRRKPPGVEHNQEPGPSNAGRNMNATPFDDRELDKRIQRTKKKRKRGKQGGKDGDRRQVLSKVKRTSGRINERTSVRGGAGQTFPNFPSASTLVRRYDLRYYSSQKFLQIDEVRRERGGGLAHVWGWWEGTSTKASNRSSMQAPQRRALGPTGGTQDQT
ncbi:hypothetical protein DFP72DRAFT_1111042 [Ephemerocybe angulata]|uniref:Uncharacterized protein n=1 Tax=Ephemerocybe angulata TaxID=980116 RepID=A0A8H6LS85_9AGAR|nr:hypothetical protein DFP72DRAFT_1111042 [Tulosesus angulatus]